MLRSKRMGARMVVKAVAVGALVGCGSVGCTPEEEDAKQTSGSVEYAYTEQRLIEMGMLPKRAPGDRIASVKGTTEFLGHVTLRPLTQKSEECLEELKQLGVQPMNMVMNFSVRGVTEGKNCVFRVTIGAPGAGWGTLRAADDKDRIVKPGEPVFAPEAGWAVMGGQNPAARGRRSRAGAPGTQFAIQLEGNTADANDYDYYYILNAPGSRKADGSPYSLEVCGQNDDPKEPATLTTDSETEQYIVVGPDGKAKAMPLNPDLGDPRRKFCEAAKKVANCTSVPGGN